MKNKKTILSSSAAIVAAAALLAGGTFAAFSDFAEVSDNDVAAGFLQLNLQEDARSGEIRRLEMVPGSNSQVENAFYAGSNDGDSTPNGDLYFQFSSFEDEPEGECTTNSEALAENGDVNDTDCGPFGELSEQTRLRVITYDTVNPTASCNVGLTTANVTNRVDHYSGPVMAHVNGPRILLAGNLAPGAGTCVRTILDIPSLPNGQNNKVQGDAAVYDVKFDLEQS